MAFQILLLFLGALSVQSQVLPQRCNTLKSNCVGEGSSCSTQFDGTCFDYSGAWSTCNKCADDSLICHGGKCLKRTQGRGEQCYDDQHKWCQSGLVCSGSVCQDPLEINQPQNFLARGETCQTTSDCYDGTCDMFLNKCVKDQNQVDTASQEVLCTDWSDCLWGEYCSPADTTASPQIQATCKKVPGGFDNRANGLCKPGGTNFLPTGQCGWTQFCMAQNQDESDGIGHPNGVSTSLPFTANTCIQPFSLPEGAMCPIPELAAGSVGWGRLSAGGTQGRDTNRYPISFCASGPCVRSGPNNQARCSAPDYTYSGTGCSAANQCGRGMACGCTTQGGGRMRCYLDSTYQSWELGRQEWFGKIQPFLACLERNQCTLNTNLWGSCAQKNCDGYLYKQPKSCDAGAVSTPLAHQPNYKGYADTIGSASHAAPSLIIFAVLFMFYAMLH